MPDILVIDDEPVIAELVRSVLAEAGYGTTLAASLEAAAGEADPDLIVTDLLGLADFQGDRARDWIRSVRDRFPGKPILVCTAHSAATAEPDMLGADAVVAKPFDIDALTGAVARLLAPA